jgi:hypothetical protein
MDWNYYDTFITASEDSPARTGAVPPDREGRPTVAFAQFHAADPSLTRLAANAL